MSVTTVVIKAYNEEVNIARAVESALAAVHVCGGDVVLADSASTDRTVEIAARYPVRIVRLADPRRRCCGVGPQLGFQAATGDTVYILDGDMEMDAAFLPAALAELQADPTLAGVGGIIRETRADNMEFQARINRQKRRKHATAAGFRDHLAGGALYRRAALLDVGYMSDKNLHAFEEFDLGARLAARGWRLKRLDVRAADHFAYELDTWPLLAHRLRSGSFLGIGEVARAAAGAGYFAAFARSIRAFQLAAGVLAFWLAALAIAWLSSWSLALILIGATLASAVAVMAQRHKSLGLGAFSVLSWHLGAAGLLLGALRRRRPPGEPIPCTEITGVPMRPLSAAG